MAKKAQRRRRDTKYVTRSYTLNAKKVKKVEAIARVHHPNRSAAVEEGIDLLIEKHK